MNRTFDWNRFKKLVAMDARGLWPRYGWVMLVLALLPLIGWTFMIVIGALAGQEIQTVPEWRLFVIMALGLICSCVAPSQMFGRCDVPKKGIYYAMLPASHLEKYLSQVLFCVVVCPLLCIAGGVVLDLLLSVIPFGPYKHYLWQCDLLQKASEALDSGMIDGDVDVNGVPIQQVVAIKKMFASVAAAAVISWFFYVSSFMLTNTIFKSWKVLKTLLAYVVLNIVVSIAMPILIAMGLSAWMDKLMTFDNEDVLRTYFIIVWTENAINVGLVLLMQWLTYRRLKRMRY